MRIAAMDLGTNTFLCLVAEKDFSGQPAVIWDGVEIVRLGQGIDQTGLLHPDALARGRTCLEQFKQKCLEFKVDKIMALATSAARDAKNKDQFLEILSDLQIPLKIISGSEEAHYTYHGGLFGFAEDVLNKHDENIVIDIGGGSTEIILGHHKNILWAESLNIGGVRLTEKFISQQPVSAEDWSKAQQHVTQILKPTVDKLKQHKFKKVVAVAGTPTSIAAIEVGDFIEEKVHGFVLSQDRLKYWLQNFAQKSVKEKQDKYQLGGRADIIFIGTLILHTFLEMLNQDSLLVSTKGVRYGLAEEMLRASHSAKI